MDWRSFVAGSAAVVIIGIVVIAAVLLAGPYRGTVIWADHPPCQSPAVGPPGGCLLPAGYTPLPQ